MPDKVKKAGSFFILSTYVTSLAIAVTLFGGGILKNSYDDNKEISSIKDSSENIQSQMGELFKFHYDTQLKVKEHDVVIKNCKSDIRDCQQHIIDLHRGRIQ